jgi:ABC-type proline/glycine betaine transport system substrate-binding protein
VTRVAAGLGLLLALVVAARAEDAAPPAPKTTLEIAEPTWDAGKITRGTTLSHAFQLKNVGTTELSIDAKPG